MVLLGIAAVIWPQVSSLAVGAYVGWLFLLRGVVGLAMIFFAPSTTGFLWSLLTGALALFTGVLLLWHPVEGVVSLTLVLVAFFFAEGVSQIAAAFVYRSAFPESWGGCLPAVSPISSWRRDHCRMAELVRLSVGTHCRREPHHVWPRNHYGSSRSAKSGHCHWLGRLTTV